VSKKNDKNGPKVDKNCAKIALFCTFSVFVLLKFLRVVDWGGGTAPSVIVQRIQEVMLS